MFQHYDVSYLANKNNYHFQSSNYISSYRKQNVTKAFLAYGTYISALLPTVSYEKCLG